MVLYVWWQDAPLPIRGRVQGKGEIAVEFTQILIDDMNDMD